MSKTVIKQMNNTPTPKPENLILSVQWLSGYKVNLKWFLQEVLPVLQIQQNCYLQ